MPRKTSKPARKISSNGVKICITSTGPDLDSLTDPRFGRAMYFLLFDGKGKLKEALPNPGVRAIRGAGVAAAQEVADRGIDVLITGNIGPNASGVLLSGSIKIFLAPTGISVKEVFDMWQENKLSQIRAPSVPGGLGRGRGGFGRGQGRWHRGPNWPSQ